MTYRQMMMGASALSFGLMLVGTASAQTVPPATPAQPAAPAAAAPVPAATPAKPAEAAPRQAETIVVTGSRIRRDSFNSAAPIQVITAEDTELEGIVDAAEVIQGSTQAAGSFQINSTFTGFVVEGGPGVNSVSLRGLGATRSLILLNGKRLPPSGVRGQVGAVDLNVIPNSMISQYQFLKDGASTIYGSDAIGGVVNLITKSNQDGGIVNGYYNMTEDGGGEQISIDASYGWNFDRGNIFVGVEYYDRGNLSVKDRDWAGCFEDYVFNPTTGERADIIDPKTGSAKCFNLWQQTVRVLSGTNLGEYVVDPSSTTGPVAGFRRIRNQSAANGPITSLTDALIARPYRSENSDTRSLLSPVSRATAYATARYQLPFGEDVEAKAEVLFNRRESEQFNYAQLFGFGPALRAGVPGNPASPFGTGQADSLLLRPAFNSQTVDTYRINATLSGGFGDAISFLSDWTWEVYAQVGRGEGEYQGDVIVGNEGVATVLGDETGPFFQALRGCPAGSASGCKPFSWFNPSFIQNGLTREDLSFFGAVETGKTVYEQNIFEASVTGSLFKLPAGEVEMAAGLALREESINDVPGEVSRSGNNLFGTAAGITKGTDKLREAYVEFDVPVLQDAPLAERLTLNVSGRYTDYDSYGEDSVYKIGVNWQISPEFRVSSTAGTNYRAPALFELFLSNQTSFAGQGAIDPCIEWSLDSNPAIRTNCSALGLPALYQGVGATAQVTLGGGAGFLEAETAENQTLTFTWTPSFANLSLAATFYEIEITNGVESLGAGTIVSLCYDGRNPELCSLHRRDLTGTPATNPEFGRIIDVKTGYVNVASQRARGIDLEARYRKEFSFGKLEVNSSASWNFSSFFELLGDETESAGLIYQPEFVGELDVRFDRGDWTFGWNVDVIGRASNYDFNEELTGNRDLANRRDGAQVVRVKANTEPQFTHDVSVRYSLDTWRFQVGIQNIFDETPPSVSAQQVVGWYTRVGNSLAGGPYDILGRRAYFDIRKTF
jgi:iron complex outermembrane receptor protein